MPHHRRRSSNTTSGYVALLTLIALAGIVIGYLIGAL